MKIYEKKVIKFLFGGFLGWIFIFLTYFLAHRNELSFFIINFLVFVIGGTILLLADQIFNKKNRLISKMKDNYKKLEEQNFEIEALYNQLTAYNNTIDNLNGDLNSFINKYKILLESITNFSIMKDYSEREFLSKIYKIAKKIVDKYDYGVVFIYEDEIVDQVVADGYDLEAIRKLKLLKSIVEKSYPETGIYHTKESTLGNLMNKKRLNEFLKVTPNSKSILYMSIKNKNNTIGGLFLELDKESTKKFVKEDMKIILALESLAKSYYEKISYNNILKNRMVDIVESMTNMLEVHDLYTKGHSLNVAKLAEALGKKMKLTNGKIKNLYLSGLLHDIGKTFISSKIINKKDRLTIEEYEIIKTHPIKGYKVLKSIEGMESISKNVKYHHERWDGTGYPDGLKKNEIPIEAQILSIVDAYDSMISDRSYRKGLSKIEAINEIKDNMGTQFAPDIAEIFIKMFKNKEILFENEKSD